MQQPPKLDYAVADPAERGILAKLEAQEQAHRLAMFLKLVVGIPASFAAPLLVTLLITSIALEWEVGLNFGLLFTGLSVLLVPLIYWWAMRHRTAFLSEVAAEVGSSDPYHATSYGEWEMRTTWLSWAVYLELFFWGPYIVLDAWGVWRGREVVTPACRMLAAQIVRHLGAREGGLPVTELGAGAPRAVLMAVLQYLVQYGWIGLSKGKDRIWLLSQARQRLR